MKISIFTISAFVIYIIGASAQSEAYFSWTKKIGATFSDYGNSIAIDTVGNVYITGYFYGTVDFDPGAGVFNLTTVGAKDVFVSKLDSSGNFIWAKQFGGTSNDVGVSITVSTGGNVYTTGYFYDTVDFDPGPGTFNLVSAGDLDAFVSKLDVSGNFIWAKRLGGANYGGASYTECSSIVIDAGENGYITGFFHDTVDFDPGLNSFNLIALGSWDIFVSKLDSSGNFIWAKQFGGSNYAEGRSIAVDEGGNVYTTGMFYDTVNFDPGIDSFNLIALGSGDIFVSKLDASGNFIWAKQLGGSGYGDGRSIAVDKGGIVYISGYFGYTLDFDPGAGVFNLNSIGYEDIFVSKLDSSGNFIWTKQLGGKNTDKAYSIDIDAIGNIYTTGIFGDTAEFDPGPGIFNLTPAGLTDIFVHKLDSAGNFIWAKQFGGKDPDWSYSVTVDTKGNIYTTGTFWGTADFDPGTDLFNLTSAGAQDIFVSKLGQCNLTIATITTDISCNGSNDGQASVIASDGITFYGFEKCGVSKRSTVCPHKGN